MSGQAANVRTVLCVFGACSRANERIVTRWAHNDMAETGSVPA
jgi:hypothetical protein